MNSTTANVFLAGVGGQGLVLANAVLARWALASGLDVKTSDIYGLAMRGGAVYGYHRHGKSVLSSTFAQGTGTLLIGLEPLEALRWAHMMKKGASVVVGSTVTLPSPVLLEKAPYPADVVGQLEKAGLEVHVVESRETAANLGNMKLANMVMLGTAARFLPSLDLNSLPAVLKELLPAHLVDINLTAFGKGWETY